jgi:hypothetical protein
MIAPMEIVLRVNGLMATGPEGIGHTGTVRKAPELRAIVLARIARKATVPLVTAPHAAAKAATTGPTTNAAAHRSAQAAKAAMANALATMGQSPAALASLRVQ